MRNRLNDYYVNKNQKQYFPLILIYLIKNFVTNFCPNNLTSFFKVASAKRRSLIISVHDY